MPTLPRAPGPQGPVSPNSPAFAAQAHVAADAPKPGAPGGSPQLPDEALPPAKRPRSSTLLPAALVRTTPAHAIRPREAAAWPRVRHRATLPSELWLQVARRAELTPRELVRLTGLSRQFQDVFADNDLWYGTNEDVAQLAQYRALGLPVRRDLLFYAFQDRVRRLTPPARQMLGDIYRQGEGYVAPQPMDRRWASHAGHSFDLAMAAARYGLFNPSELQLLPPWADENRVQRALLMLDAGHPRSSTYRLLPLAMRDDVQLAAASLRGRPRHFAHVPPKLAGRPQVLQALFANDVTLALHALSVDHPGLLGSPTVADALVAACTEGGRPRPLGAAALHQDVQRSWAHVPRELLHRLPVARALLRAFPAGFGLLPPAMQMHLPLLHAALQDGMCLATLPPALRDLPGVARTAVARTADQVYMLGARARRDPDIAWTLLASPRAAEAHFWQLETTVFGDASLMRALLPRFPKLAWRATYPALADARVACTLVNVGAYAVLSRLHASVAERADFLRYALLHDVHTLPYLPAALRDKDLVLRCLAADGMLLAKLPPLMNDEEAVLAAVRSRGRALRFAPPALQERLDVALTALDQDLGAIVWTALRLRDDDVLLQRYDWRARPELWRFLSYRLSQRLQATALRYRPAPIAGVFSPAGFGV